MSMVGTFRPSGNFHIEHREGSVELISPEGNVVARLEPRDCGYEEARAGFWPALFHGDEAAKDAMAEARRLGAPVVAVEEVAYRLLGFQFEKDTPPSREKFVRRDAAEATTLARLGPPRRQLLLQWQEEHSACDCAYCGGHRLPTWVAAKRPPIVVTRHPALVAVLARRGLIPEGTQVVAHATPDMVRGRTVVGILPFHLAALASSVTTVDLNLAPEQRGRELSVEEVEAALTGISTYFINNDETHYGSR